MGHGPLLIRNLQIYYFYEPLAGAAVLLGMCLDRSDPRFSRSLLQVWTFALVIIGVNGLLSNYISLYHWQSGADKVEKIQKPLLEAHRGEHVDNIIFVSGSKPFWRWAFQFHDKDPMLGELLKLPGLRVSIFDYYEVPGSGALPGGKTLYFEIDKGFNFNYFTTRSTTRNNHTYTFCYEFGYLPLENNLILIVKRNSEVN